MDFGYYGPTNNGCLVGQKAKARRGKRYNVQESIQRDMVNVHRIDLLQGKLVIFLIVYFIGAAAPL